MLTCAAAHAVPNLRVSDVSVSEGTGATATFVVSIDAAPPARRPVSVQVSTRNGSAIAGSDYRGLSTTLSFRNGEPLTRSVPVALINDTAVEPQESFSVRLSSARNAVVADGSGVATVLDDDARPNHPPTCAIDTPAGAITLRIGDSAAFSSTVTDADGDKLAIAWGFGGGSPASSAAEDPGSVRFSSVGTHTVTLEASDGRGGQCTRQSRTVTVEEMPAVSINSTSATGLWPRNDSPVPERPRVSGGNYSVFAVNDLGMHCVDLDGRIVNILPPFQVLLGQVIEKGVTPRLNPAGITLAYSAASNPNDPILARGDAFSGIADDGSVYKTNFWEGIARGTYDAFYPPIATPLATGPFPVTEDIGLPAPNTEQLHIGADGIVDGVSGSSDGDLSIVSQQAMPGQANEPQRMLEYYEHKPFFVNFPIGYVANDVNWHEAAGIPLSPFDDVGRQNPFPLVRVEASNDTSVLATSDVVLPVSSETSCSNCHGTVDDVPHARSSAPTDALINAGLPVAHSILDPALGAVPRAVSVEYGADINILRLHDLKHGANYVDTGNNRDACTINSGLPDGSESCLVNKALVQGQPVVCQACHYTPALDLAQVGPMAGPPGSPANGRNQLAHESNSRVMHNHHGNFAELFPPIPAPQQDPLTGAISNQPERTAALENNCYQCHPGKDTHCLRGAMFNGGVLCSDCHGSMKQIGADFSAGVSSRPGELGAFKLGLGNFYDPTSNQPRVPWANEPGCGSCHTGDANDNLAGQPGVMVNIRDSHGVSDGIRLRQAFVTGDARATPIVPANKRFAEPQVPAGFNGFDNPAAGNPRLYRVSSGHGGVMCEGCHGATHAEWPVADPAANDNQLAIQLQGHAGPIIECGACHTTSAMAANTLGGPHSMHLVNDPRFWKEAHKDAAKRENAKAGGGLCGDCHGADHRGTVLSRAAADRSFTVESRARRVGAGQPVACNLCHSMEKSFGR
ncbi:MAG: PKD domain-containing protein [Pseudomonadales bacterium]|nr:PKD domain-containing protein [Pseudomonadales bacterium]